MSPVNTRLPLTTYMSCQQFLQLFWTKKKAIFLEGHNINKKYQTLRVWYFWYYIFGIFKIEF